LRRYINIKGKVFQAKYSNIFFGNVWFPKKASQIPVDQGLNTERLYIRLGRINGERK
jgi:hypothetical protein